MNNAIAQRVEEKFLNGEIRFLFQASPVYPAGSGDITLSSCLSKEGQILCPLLPPNRRGIPDREAQHKFPLKTTQKAGKSTLQVKLWPKR